MKDRAEKGKSIIDFPDEYVCVDVETTGLDFDSDEIIEIGAVKVKNGFTIDKFSTLVHPKHSHVYITGPMLKSMGLNSLSDLDPEAAADFFKTNLISQRIENLTGIKNEELLSAPSEEESVKLFHDFLGDSVIVGHNVNFDVNFLFDACQRAGLVLGNSFVDTLRISRKLYPDMEHHRLSDLVERLGVEQNEQHRALSDALTTVSCYEAMKKEIEETSSIKKFIGSFDRSCQEGSSELGEYFAFQMKLNSLKPTALEFNESGPLFGKRIVFTGELSNMSREDAFLLVLNSGGTPKETVTKKTDFVVVGNGGFVKSSKDGKSSKIRKAEQYNAAGCNIKILHEDDFFALIDAENS